MLLARHLIGRIRLVIFFISMPIYEIQMEEMHIKNSKKLPKPNNMSSKAPPAQNNLREILDRIGKLS